MKTIELLTKIANSEEVPKEFIFYEKENCTFDGRTIRDNRGNFYFPGTGIDLKNFLNYEIKEEEKKIDGIETFKEYCSKIGERFDISDYIDTYLDTISIKINQLVDAVSKLQGSDKE